MGISLFCLVINVLVIVVIHVRCINSESFPASFVFFISITAAGMLEAVNTFVIFTDYIIIASSIEDIVHFIRWASLVPIYGIRLIYLVKHTILFNLSRASKITCYVVWVVAITIGVLRGLYRESVAQGKDSHRFEKFIRYYLILLMVSGLLCYAFQIITIIVMTQKYYKLQRYDTSRQRAGDDYMFVSKESVKLDMVQTGLKLLLAIIFIDICCTSYLFSLTMVYFVDSSCQSRYSVFLHKVLLTKRSFVYSYHIFGVIYGICLAITLLCQRSMYKILKILIRKIRKRLKIVCRWLCSVCLFEDWQSSYATTSTMTNISVISNNPYA